MEEVEVVDYVEHLYSFILIIIMLPICSLYALLYSYTIYMNARRMIKIIVEMI